MVDSISERDVRPKDAQRQTVLFVDNGTSQWVNMLLVTAKKYAPDNSYNTEGLVQSFSLSAKGSRKVNPSRPSFPS